MTRMNDVTDGKSNTVAGGERVRLIYQCRRFIPK